MKTYTKPDFREKINLHFIDNVSYMDTQKTEAINKIIEFIVIGFNQKNNFNVVDFNLKSLIDVKAFYSKLKTNILSTKQYVDYLEFFDGINQKQIKCVNFIFSNYKHNHVNDEDSKEIFNTISSMLRQKLN